MANKNTTDTTTVKDLINFKADAHVSGDIYQPLPGVPELSETEAENRTNKLKGQQRALGVALERTNAAAMAFKVEGAAANAQIQQTKAAISWAKLAEAQTGLQIAELSGQTAEQRRLQAVASLDYETASTKLHGQTLDLQRRGLEAGYQHAQTLFDLQGQQYTQEVSMAQNKLAARVDQAKKMKAGK